MCPEFRNAFYNLPLCGDSMDDKTDFVKPDSTKFKILFEF